MAHNEPHVGLVYEFKNKNMTQEEKDIVLHGAKYEMMNSCIDFSDGTVDREKMINAMQSYAEMYHQNELSKLSQHDVSGSLLPLDVHKKARELSAGEFIDWWFSKKQ